MPTSGAWQPKTKCPRGVRPRASDPGNPWSLRDLYPAHFAITDAGAGTFHFAEQLTRSGPGLAGAETGA